MEGVARGTGCVRAGSHTKALAARAAGGVFTDKMSAFEVQENLPDLAGGKLVARTAAILRPRDLRNFARCSRPRLGDGREHSQLSDGAAILVSERVAKELRFAPLARLASVSPEIMGIGPIAAIPKVLKAAGLTQDQLRLDRFNEAFAAQSLAVIRDLKLDPAKVNPLGGAIALGHPLGATGAIRTATIVHGLRRRKQKLRDGDDVRRHRHGRGWCSRRSGGGADAGEQGSPLALY